MSRTASELDGFTAELDQLLFTPELESPHDAPHGFAYFITIRNASDRRLTVRYRKWIVRSLATGELRVVEGEGVVGATPDLEPGEDFTYNSRLFILDDSEAEGSFFGEDDRGTVFACRLPVMKLQIPPWAKGY